MSKEVKVVLLGESGVGKSSILLRFCQNDFKVNNESTLGAAFMSKTITGKDGQQVKFQIWDTAGQEKYKSLTPLYYRDAQVAIIVYDITSRDSFDTLKNWVTELRQHGPQKMVQVLVGNKQDLIEDEKVQYDEASSYARVIIFYEQSLGAMLKLTSCKDNKGVHEMFQSVADALLTDEHVVERPAKELNQSVKVGSSTSAKKKEGGGCC